MSEPTLNSAIFSAMQTGKPYATYTKTTLGKVYVTILSPFTSKPEGLLLYGSKKDDETCSVDIWSEMEDVFFKRQNRRLLENGNIVKITKSEKELEHTIEQYSDSELKEVLSLRFLPFQKILSDIKSEAVLYRLLEFSRELEKSEKFVKAIELKLSEIQFKPALPTTTEL